VELRRNPARAAINAQRYAAAQSLGSTSSKPMDRLAVLLQSGSTNYESNSTPVPGIGNSSRNCETGTSFYFNEL
jgi:hypothetical protein